MTTEHLIRSDYEELQRFRGDRPLRAACLDWARHFVGEFRVRTPKNFAAYAQGRAGNGGKPVAKAPPRGREEDSTPIAGTKPDALSREAAAHSRRVAQARAEATPPPLDIAGQLRTGGRAS